MTYRITNREAWRGGGEKEEKETRGSLNRKGYESKGGGGGGDEGKTWGEDVGGMKAPEGRLRENGCVIASLGKRKGGWWKKKKCAFNGSKKRKLGSSTERKRRGSQNLAYSEARILMWITKAVREGGGGEKIALQCAVRG